MPLRSLPRHPSLEHLRNEARELQRQLREGAPSSLALAREFHPRVAERADRFGLSDAQLIIARSYGFSSWPKLKGYVETITMYTRNPGQLRPQDEPAEEFLRLACLNYGGDDLSHPARAAEMLHRDPSLASHSIYSAAAAGDAAVAERMLQTDRSLARTPGGPFNWEPLLYVAYSRLVSGDPRHSHLGVARLLLEHGADPNAGYLWDGAYLFTALTGTFGYGEDSPQSTPSPPVDPSCHAAARGWGRSQRRPDDLQPTLPPRQRLPRTTARPRTRQGSPRPLAQTSRRPPRRATGAARGCAGLRRRQR